MAKIAPEVQSAMQEELHFIDSLTNFYWNRVHAVSGGLVSAFTLRSTSMRAALASYSCVMHKAVQPYLGEPFSLSQGNIRENLDALARRVEKPRNAITAKI